MTSHAFFFGSTTFTDTQQIAHPTQQTTTGQQETPTSQSMETTGRSSSNEQQDDSADETAELSLHRTRRRLSTIKEEDEDDPLDNSKGNGKRRLGTRRVSLQKGGWTIQKGEPTSPPIDERKQSNSVQAHISTPPRSSPERPESEDLDGVVQFSGWEQ